MNKALNALVDGAQNMEYVLLDVQRKFKNQVASIIEVLQDGVGYVAFNKESGFPEFQDYSIDLTREVVATRVVVDDVIKRIEIITNDDFDGNYEDGWYRPCFYGNLDIHTMFDSLKNIVEQTNK